MAPDISRTEGSLHWPVVGGEAGVDGIVGTGAAGQGTDFRQGLSAVSARRLTAALATWGGIRGSSLILSSKDKRTGGEEKEEKEE